MHPKYMVMFAMTVGSLKHYVDTHEWRRKEKRVYGYHDLVYTYQDPKYLYQT